MDWARILGSIITAIKNVLTIFTTTGSEPVAGDVDTIENTNKLISDEIASLNTIITYSIPVEYRTCYEAKTWYNSDTNYSFGGRAFTRTWLPLITGFNDTSAFLFSTGQEVGSSANITSNYIYLYETGTEIPIVRYWKTLPVKFEFDGTNFNVYAILDVRKNTYTKYSYSIDGTFLSSETIADVYNVVHAVVSSTSTEGNILKSDLGYFVSPFTCINLNNPATFRFLPQEVGDKLFIGVGDKGYYFNQDYAVTKIVFFNEPMLIGHGLTPRMIQNIKIVGDSYYRVNQYGKVERFKL